MAKFGESQDWCNATARTFQALGFGVVGFRVWGLGFTVLDVVKASNFLFSVRYHSSLIILQYTPPPPQGSQLAAWCACTSSAANGFGTNRHRDPAMVHYHRPNAPAKASVDYPCATISITDKAVRKGLHPYCGDLQLYARATHFRDDGQSRRQNWCRDWRTRCACNLQRTHLERQRL